MCVVVLCVNVWCRVVVLCFCVCVEKNLFCVCAFVGVSRFVYLCVCCVVLLLDVYWRVVCEERLLLCVSVLL